MENRVYGKPQNNNVTLNSIENIFEEVRKRIDFDPSVDDNEDLVWYAEPYLPREEFPGQFVLNSDKSRLNELTQDPDEIIKEQYSKLIRKKNRFTSSTSKVKRRFN